MAVKLSEKTKDYMSKKLKALREEKNLSQESVAESVGISVTHYAGIERGEENPTVAVIEALCDLFKIRSSDILHF